MAKTFAEELVELTKTAREHIAAEKQKQIEADSRMMVSRIKIDAINAAKRGENDMRNIIPYMTADLLLVKTMVQKELDIRCYLCDERTPTSVDQSRYGSLSVSW